MKTPHLLIFAKLPVSNKRLGLVSAAVALLVVTGCVAPVDFSGPSRLAQEGRYPEAIRAYEQMRGGLRSQAAATVDFQIAQLRTRYVSQILAQANACLNTGETLPNLKAGLSVVEAGLSYDDQPRRLAAERVRLLSRADALRKQIAGLPAATVRASNGDWQGAIDQMLAIQAIVGDLTPDQKALLQSWVSSRDESNAKSVRARLQKRDVAGADAELKVISSFKPAMRAELTAALTAELNSLQQSVFIGVQMDLVEKKHFYTAYRNLKAADFPAARELLPKVAGTGSAYYRAVAQSEIDTDLRRLGYAYFAITKAKELNSDDLETFKLHRTISDAIEEFITTRIAVAGFESPANWPGMGAQVSDALISYLIDHLPYGIKLLDRSQVDQILAGRANALETIGKQLGLEVVVVGNVASFSVERKRNEGKATQTVVVGVNVVPNPAYSQFVEMYGRNTTKWPSIPPQNIEKPERQQFTYNRGEETLTGMMVAYVRSFETAKGLVTQSREFTASVTHKDDFQDAVKDANITFDPLVLPSDNTVRETLRAELVKQVASDAVKRYARRELRYLRDAEFYLARKEKDTAVLQLAGGHYYTTVATDPVDKEGLAAIDRLGMIELTE
jgi:hypothetical protein